MLKRTNVTGIKIYQLEERKVIPSNLKWNGEIPPSYFISLVENPDKDDCIIVCADGFGGGMSWARLDKKPNLIGKELDISEEEKQFLKLRYPTLYEAITNL